MSPKLKRHEVLLLQLLELQRFHFLLSMKINLLRLGAGDVIWGQMVVVCTLSTAFMLCRTRVLISMVLGSLFLFGTRFFLEVLPDWGYGIALFFTHFHSLSSVFTQLNPFLIHVHPFQPLRIPL